MRGSGTLIDILFGWGFAAQLPRAAKRGMASGFTRRFLRRMGILGLIGAGHVLLLSEGDILLLYALIGLPLLPLRHARPAILLRWVKLS